jgi:hypothetical protein
MSTQEIMAAVINWLPMILIFGVWIFFIYRLRRGPFTKYQKDCLDLVRRQTDALERIEKLLERR